VFRSAHLSVVVEVAVSAVVLRPFGHVQFGEEIITTTAVVVGTGVTTTTTNAVVDVATATVVAWFHLLLLLWLLLELLLLLMLVWIHLARDTKLRIMRAVVGLVTRFEAGVTDDVGFHQLGRDVGLRQVKGWVSEFAFSAIGTESDEVVDAEHPSRMPMTTAGSVPTEASIVPRAVFDLGRGVDVLKGTFFVETSAELLVEIALGHLGHVVFVEKLAVVALLAKTPQPMLANHRPVTSDVPIGTHVLPLTISSEKEVADGRGGFVHAGEWIGQNADMVVEGDFHVENVKVIDGAQRVHHLERCCWSEV